ncbi:hypothetical protein F5Y04DRAFT_243557 [Hypomontagnella monticulosa]|nr:hypothetical protein F5Y04DRAFT_243557 [Hypomontagnella monticulosa]
MQLVGWSISETSFPLCSISYGALILFLMLLLLFYLLSVVLFLFFFRRRRLRYLVLHIGHLSIFLITFVSLRLSASIRFSSIYFPFPPLLLYLSFFSFPYCVM